MLFSDQVSILESLNIPNLGDFMLFALAARCLPVSTRKGFEATNKQEFPTVSDMVFYVKNRVSLLEAVNFSSSSGRPALQQDKSKFSLSHQHSKKSIVTLVTSKHSPSTSTSIPTSKCVFFAGEHKSANCLQFSQLPLEHRYQTARDKRMCFRCLNSTHWSNSCKVLKSCDKCTGRHYSLLHCDDNPTKNSQPTEASLVSSLDQPTVLLGTAIVHIRDQSGCIQSIRALVDSASQISIITTSCVELLE